MKQGPHATYENLLWVCCEAGATDAADAICKVLKSRVQTEGDTQGIGYGGMGLKNL